MRAMILPAMGAETAPPVVKPPVSGHLMRLVHHDQNVVAVGVQRPVDGKDRGEGGEVLLAAVVVAVDQFGRRAGLAAHAIARNIGAAPGAVGWR